MAGTANVVACCVLICMLSWCRGVIPSSLRVLHWHINCVALYTHVGAMILGGYEQDVCSAREAGCSGLLVWAGKHRDRDEAGVVASEAVLTSVALLP
jgi:hypothetical protein